MVDEGASKIPGSVYKVSAERGNFLRVVPIPEPYSTLGKVQDLGSALFLEGRGTVFKDLAESMEQSHPSRIADKEITGLYTRETVKMEDFNMFRRPNTASETLDLNFDVGPSTSMEASSSKNNIISRNNSSKVYHDARTAPRGPLSNLNVGDCFSLGREKPSRPFKRQAGFLKLNNSSECGSRTGSPPDEKEALRVWKEMKENGFLSSSHGGIPAPKQRGRRNKSDSLKRRIELAKKEQVDKFAKLAAPTGLLNELNPGIINHVRNSKQVHSIIEALVKSEKAENPHFEGKVGTLIQSKSRDIHDRSKNAKNSKHFGSSFFPYSHENDSRPSTFVVKSKKSRSNAMTSSEQNQFTSNGSEYLTMGERKSHGKYFLHGRDDNRGMLASKLPPSHVLAPEATCYFSEEEFVNLSNIHFLSAKAATVASQWLELLVKDIEGRLTALRQSKDRLHAVIHTEFPYLYSVEFSSNEEDDPNTVKKSPQSALKSTVEMHVERWSVLFSQMDKTLSEEQKQLENWLEEVKEMHTHCQWGLEHLPWNSPNGFQDVGASNKESRLGPDLAVQAAAASIYSTSSFLFSTTNNT